MKIFLSIIPWRRKSYCRRSAPIRDNWNNSKLWSSCVKSYVAVASGCLKPQTPTVISHSTNTKESFAISFRKLHYSNYALIKYFNKINWFLSPQNVHNFSIYFRSWSTSCLDSLLDADTQFPSVNCIDPYSLLEISFFLSYIFFLQFTIENDVQITSNFHHRLRKWKPIKTHIIDHIWKQ